jgi:hypothetical protein
VLLRPWTLLWQAVKKSFSWYLFYLIKIIWLWLDIPFGLSTFVGNLFPLFSHSQSVLKWSLYVEELLFHALSGAKQIARRLSLRYTFLERIQTFSLLFFYSVKVDSLTGP